MTGRDIVKRAAEEKSSAREWLFRDEFGSWEALGNEWLDETSDRRARENISDEVTLEELSLRMLILAVQALLADARKHNETCKPKRRR